MGIILDLMSRIVASKSQFDRERAVAGLVTRLVDSLLNEGGPSPEVRQDVYSALAGIRLHDEGRHEEVLVAEGALRLASSTYSRRADRRLLHETLRRGRGRVLRAAAETPLVSLGSLAERLNLTVSAVSKSVKLLEERGLLTKSQSEQDARQVLVDVTHEGARVARLQDAQERASEEVLTGNSDLFRGEPVSAAAMPRDLSARVVDDIGELLGVEAVADYSSMGGALVTSGRV